MLLLSIFPITVNLNVLHFAATTVVLIILLIHAYARWDKMRRHADEVMDKQWGLQGYVNGEGRYVSRVKEDD